jgi:pimeloyl-ACP methyl ester carboxylesterase
MRWTQRLLALAGIVVVGWVCVTSWGAIRHGHPLYAVLLGLTLVVAIYAGLRSFRSRPPVRGGKLILGLVLAVLAVAWLAAIAWLKPFTALEPALTAMESTGTVRVEEAPTSITLLPGLDMNSTGLFFQPGAKVDARAYAAVLRPLADAGYTVVIAKQPLGIAFLATGAFETARDANPDVTQWVVSGHSLGGTVAAMDADAHDQDAQAPVTGLLLYASYPASDISRSLVSRVLSISGSEDGLATPADIEDSRLNLPQDSEFEVIDGAVHAFFGDYGLQPGDGIPTIDHDEARSQIAKLSLDFVSAQKP